ncbi:DUF2945 domain-containing protein [Aquibium sp. A9E412]|uniref:DUF2945 domain-containing protein n=1 Tax=Aquibium sp. A9E412 TaxID=2976767 RepID=UPI0025AFC216|nr:DUF2945 domain-containing protein [Aquibium sp. A9E412]MDN2565782.1 DUF2945 domain-containing protein [Aquibium sp. A9E412]
MTRFGPGDHVSCKCEAGREGGEFIGVYQADFRYNGPIRRALRGEPQCAIKSDRTEHVAAHKEAA